MRACALIPTYNESRHIGGVIRGARAHNLDVVVVDDGSADNTAQLAREAGAFVIENRTNNGKGYSLNEGIAYVLDKGCDCVLTMDGDGQHDPREIPNFIRRFQETAPDLLVGNRMEGLRSMPMVRRATNMFMSFIISKITGQAIPDSQCGFRLISRRVLENLTLRSRHFEVESEMIFEAAKNNYRIESIPIATIYRSEKSAIKPFRDTIRFLKLLIRYIR